MPPRPASASSVEPLNRFECYFLNTAERREGAGRGGGRAELRLSLRYVPFQYRGEEPAARDPRHGRRFNHVHISENDRGTPGTGPIDFASVFKALKAIGYDGWMTVEAFGSALPDLAAATRVWRPLFEKPEDVYLGAIKLMRRGWAAA